MNEMAYQDYLAKIEYDSIDKIFVGHIIGIEDMVSFHGSTVEELESEFHDAVHHYLEICEKIGQEPQKSYSGRLTVQIPPEVHRAVATVARINSKSVNQWVESILMKSANIEPAM